MTLDTGARAAIFVAHGMTCVSDTASNQYLTPGRQQVGGGVESRVEG